MRSRKALAHLVQRARRARPGPRLRLPASSTSHGDELPTALAAAADRGAKVGRPHAGPSGSQVLRALGPQALHLGRAAAAGGRRQALPVRPAASTCRGARRRRPSRTTTTSATASTPGCSARRWPTPARSTRRRRHARAGAGREVRPRLPQARPAARPCGCSTSAAAGAGWSVHAAALRRARLSASRCRGSRPSGAQKAIADAGLTDLAEVRHLDYRSVHRDRLRRGQLDRSHRAHRRCATCPAYAAFLSSRAAPRRTAAQPLHHPAAQSTCRRSPSAASSVATSSPTASCPVPAELLRALRATPASRSGTRRTCASTTPRTCAAWCDNLDAALGRGGGRGRARRPRGSGCSTWPAPGSASSAT